MNSIAKQRESDLISKHETSITNKSGHEDQLV